MTFISSLWNAVSFDDLHRTLTRVVNETSPDQRIRESSLVHLFSSCPSTAYPVDLHVLFVCSLLCIIDPRTESIVHLRLFRRLIVLLNNYYVHQQDLFDDNEYRLVVVHLVSKLLGEVHRRRGENDHDWYRLYLDVPIDDPLPTFDLFADLLGLLATLCYNHRPCQDEVRHVHGTIESILSMTRIDLNQPKAHTCVVWLIRCLTESNEENRDYIKQIQ